VSAGDGRTGPLAPYRVVDLTMNMSGPLATMVLADQGADVVKVEPPGGDVIRRVGTGRGGTSAYFANLNRNKRSIVVDLSGERGRDVVRRLSDGADVFVQNFRLGVIERLGLGAEELCRSNPRLVHASITGFGRSGPLVEAPAYDHVVQALSGIAARQADPRGGAPDLVRHGLVDKATAYTTAEAIVTALLCRERTGQGAVIEVSMLDVALNFLWPDGMMNHTCLDDVPQVPAVAGSFRLTPTADGHVSLVSLTDEQWRGLLAAAGLEEDERTSTVEGRMMHGGETMRAVKARLAEMPTAEVVARMAERQVPCAPVVGLADLRAEPQVVAAGVLEELAHPVLGRILQPRPAARMPGVAEGSWSPRPAPAAGEHTEEVLGEAGFTGAEIAELQGAGVIA